MGKVFMEADHDCLDLNVHLTLFNARIIEGTPQMLEHTDIRWIAVEEISRYEFCPADQMAMFLLPEEQDIPSPTGRPRWDREALNKLIPDEKYTGRVLLQETIIAGSSQIKNDGFMGIGSSAPLP